MKTISTHPLFLFPLTSLLSCVIVLTLSALILPTPLHATDTAEQQLEEIDNTLATEEAKLLEMLEGKSEAKAKPSVAKTVKASFHVDSMNTDLTNTTSLDANSIDEILVVSEDEVVEKEENIKELENELNLQKQKLQSELASLDELEIKTTQLNTDVKLAEIEAKDIKESRARLVAKKDSLYEKVAERTKEQIKTNVMKKQMVKKSPYQVPSRVRPLVNGMQVRQSEAVYEPSNRHFARVAAKTVAMRYGPANSFPPAFRAQKDEKIEVQKQYNGWYRVVHSSGALGWIEAKDLVFGGQPLNLPGRVMKVKGSQS